MRVRAWLAELGTGVGVVAIGLAMLAVPRGTPLIGGAPTWVGLAVFAFGLLLIVLSTGTYLYERLGSPKVYLRSPFYRTGGHGSSSAPARSAQTRTIIDRTPGQLTANFKGTTTAEGKDRVARYIDSWMRVSGPIRDVSVASPTMACVLFANQSLFTWDDVYAWFRERTAIDRLKLLIPGDRVAVLGRITGVDATTVTLDDCVVEHLGA